ncbi:hypothetical protein KAR91_51940 [Candidatus Pacearchaeota archaeon]|nr:hypothetical protein [Candidatus Pacearchaeota archaeon]
MSNPDFSENKRGLGGRALAPPPTGMKSKASPSFIEKPGPAGGLPGKSGGNRNPSGFGKRGKFNVKSEGL